MDRAERVKRAITLLKDFHEAGRTVPPAARGKDVKISRFKSVRINKNLLRTARQFANPVSGYSRDELAELCNFIEQEQPSQPSSFAIFGRTHVIRLLSAPSKVRRLALQKEAIEGGWSTSRLETEVTVRYGTRQVGGRKAKIPDDDVGVLGQIEGFCERWRRWYCLVSVRDESDHYSGAPLSLLSQAIRTRVSHISHELMMLQAEVNVSLKTHWKLRKLRPIAEGDKPNSGPAEAIGKKKKRG